MVEVGFNFMGTPLYMNATNRLIAASATIVLLSVASAAAAQDITYNVGATTDYVTRGSSQTNHQPAYSAGVDATFTNGFYVGAWTSTVDFGDGTDQEIDLYGGYRTTAAGWGLDFGLASYNYTNDPGEGLDMVEAIAVASRTFGPVATTFTVAYSPDYFNVGSPSVWSEAGASIPLTSKLSATGSVGYQYLEDENLFPSYSTYNVGVVYALTKHLSVDARYTSSDLDENVVGFFADDSYSLGLTASF